VKPRYITVITLFTIALCLACLASKPARAQYFSNQDGYTDNGAYRVQVELSPYLWLPATSGKIGFARQAVANHISGNFSSSVPSISSLASTLHFSFMGASLLRYGPYSAEMDLQYINASQSKTLLTTASGAVLRVNAKASYVRIAPGVGYQVFTGDIHGVPVSADARAGFAYFTHSQTLKGEGSLTGEVSDDGDFIQPWLGGRVDIILAPRWRIEIGALTQGLGVSGGSWGWGTSVIGSYAFSDRFAADAGFRALSTDRTQGSRDTPGASNRSLSITAYGPVLGVSFRF
jgi:hypothetical protein